MNKEQLRELAEAAKKAPGLSLAWIRYDDAFTPSTVIALLDRIKALEDELEALIDSLGVQVCEVGKMPGTDGFTMACFRADDVPVGSKLYAIKEST